ETSFDLCIDKIRPITLDTDRRRTRGLVKCVVRIGTTAIVRLLHHLIVWLAALGWIDFGEAESQTAVPPEQDREIGRIDLREIPQDVDQSAQTAGNRQVHSLPH